MQQNNGPDEASAANGEWISVGTLDGIEPGAIQQVAVGNDPVALYNVEGTICATSDICTHGRASLSQGYLDGDVIECPLHQGLFNVRTGKAMGPPVTQDIKTFAVRVADGEIFVRADG